jgi:hypothetical protein
MNVPRRLDALNREIGYRQEELVRVEKMRAAGEPTILALPKFIKIYCRDIETAIRDLKAEIRDLNRFPDSPKVIKALRFARRFRRKLLRKLTPRRSFS